MAIKQFSLGSILQFRKQQEDLARQKFVLAQIEEKKVEESLHVLQQELSSLIQTLEKKQETGILTFELARYEERINYLRQQISLTKRELEEKKKVVQHKKIMLLKKSKEHKILEKLKENQNIAWQEYQNKKEAAMLDEIAVLHHERNDRDTN
ncbi:MAG: flagellar export protein FliJ [Proteobacteria bacterium]|nr:flagellar export protein FliJ [Pseudomonadota bacterium]MBU1232275.1 flagellar export protein FliJ [Pseudomonadota bacterium]MBU1416956.1 flagellar export protein FliJ [Pseudomonadota bacterium]MBU1454667.1 flagellar export protein FliJ [Pseudomonadota bacterium]